MIEIKKICKYIVLQLMICAILMNQQCLAYINCSFSRYIFLFDGIEKSVNAAILNETKMVGIISFCEEVGIPCDYDDTNAVTIYFCGNEYSFTDGESAYNAGDMSCEAIDSGEDLYIPFEMLTQLFGYTLSWDNLTLTVTADPDYEGSYGAMQQAIKVLYEDGCDYTDSNMEFVATDAVYVTAGTSTADTNYSTATALQIKNAGENVNTDKQIYLKFDLSSVAAESAETAYISLVKSSDSLNSGGLGTGQYYMIEAYETTNGWEESTITYANKPGAGNKLNQIIVGPMAPSYNKYKIDLTNYVNNILSGSGSKVFSVVIKGASGTAIRTNFKKTGSDAPKLVLTGAGGTPGEGSVFVKEDLAEYTEESYCYSVLSSTASKTNYQTAKGRAVSSLTEFDKNVDTLDVYGGLANSVGFTATGYFHTEKKDGRWYIVDPIGNCFFSSGVNAVRKKESSAQETAANNLYSTSEAWGSGVTASLKNMKFNTAGAWSQFEYLKNAQEELAYARMIECMATYADEIGENYGGVGNDAYKYSNCMPVFNPGFEASVDATVRNGTQGLTTDAHTLGWMSDNELPADADMLDRYLGLDPTVDPATKYSSCVAWEWLRRRTGLQNPTINDINDTLREQWRQFVYDRYYQVVSKAFKTYAPNHMYLGIRLIAAASRSSGIVKSTGKYADILCVNYYFCWTPQTAMMSDWAEWSGKPFIVTESYAMDNSISGMYAYGGGWVVENQTDRAKFYQNYTLRLLESKNCVGFHWFKFLDNDYRASGGKQINKGIYNSEYQLYTELAEGMTEVNQYKYALQLYFDEKNAE